MNAEVLEWPSVRPKQLRLPRHLGVIPDGNRRWAQRSGRPRHDGYGFGIEPGIRLYRACRELGIEDISVYGFTKDNVKRPAIQVQSFKAACVDMVERLEAEDARVRVVGDEDSPVFPERLRGYAGRGGKGPTVHLLVNYGWEWDLEGIRTGLHRTADIPPLDLIIRWGGGRRLSGFLPIQSVYSDFFVVDDYWPDFEEQHLSDALAWYSVQDRTRGG